MSDYDDDEAATDENERPSASDLIDESFQASANLSFTVTGGPWNTQIQITGTSPGGIAVTYTNPPNNPFATNNVYVFTTQQGSTSLPNTTAIATASAPVSGGTVVYPSGSGSFGSIPYIVAYSLNPAVTSSSGGTTTTTYPDIVATAYLPGVQGIDPSQIQYFASSLQVATVQPQLVQVSYTFPPGFNPGGAAWVGIWANETPPYNAPPLAAGPARGSANTGSVFVQVPTTNPIAANANYTVALYSSGWTTNPANLPTNNVATYAYLLTGNPVGS